MGEKEEKPMDQYSNRVSVDQAYLNELKRKAAALDWREEQKQTIEIHYDEGEKQWVAEDLIDRKWMAHSYLAVIEAAQFDWEALTP